MAHLRWRDWLQLVRVPNLFTVPGDPLAGYLLATTATFGPGVLLPMAASLCFYIYGLLCNDLFDLAEDRRERPDRPLPRGAAHVQSVGLVAAVCAAIGLAVCIAAGSMAWVMGIALIGTVLIYDAWLKSIAVFGAVNMGACRGLSLLLGAAFGESITPRVLAAAGIVTVYVAAVTNLARHETRPSAPVAAKWLPFLVLTVSPFIFCHERLQTNVPVFLAFFALALMQTGLATRRVVRGGPVPPEIGAMIRALIPLQAAFCAGSNTGWIGGGAALLLLALWPVSRLAGRRFYSS